MAILDPNAARSLKPLINVLWAVFMVCFVVSLGCRFALGGWPEYLSLLESLSTLIIILGLGAIGYLIARRNPLVR